MTAQQKIVERYIKALGIKCASPEQLIRELSGGNQQKVLLARWLCMDPRLLIVDEPTRGIDVGAKAEILKLLRTLADEGLSVLMISSELEELIAAADHVTVLSDGYSVRRCRRRRAQRGAADGGHGASGRGRGMTTVETANATQPAARRRLAASGSAATARWSRSWC